MFMPTTIPQQQADDSLAQARSSLLAIDIPTDIPLQQQTDAFFALAKSQIPADLLQDLLSPVEQLIAAGAVERALKEGAQAPDGSGSFEDAGPFQVVAMEEEAQANFMHHR
jgi:hypothetical protein